MEDTVVVQQKQTAIWEALRVDTATRIALMNKYSSEAFSPGASLRVVFVLLMLNDE